MVTNIIKAFKGMVSQLDWMDDVSIPHNCKMKIQIDSSDSYPAFNSRHEMIMRI